MAGVAQLLDMCNAEAVSLRGRAAAGLAEFREMIIEAVAPARRGSPRCSDGAWPAARCRLYAVLEHPRRGTLSAGLDRCPLTLTRRITPDCPQAHWFEREIAEQWGIVPQGHPWLKPIRFHASYRPAAMPGTARTLPRSCQASADYFRVEGEEVHEVAVGPVHAGIIEPGHFRFQCHGENVCHLEISLGFQHRGIERALIGGPGKRTLPYMETRRRRHDDRPRNGVLPGRSRRWPDREVPPRAQALRAVALELERIANHVGDLGALAGDVAYLPTASFCGRIRGDFLNMTALLCGSRFGRGMVVPAAYGSMWMARESTSCSGVSTPQQRIQRPR